MIHSDLGNQLVAANKELRQMIEGWDVPKIIKFGTSEGMRWSFNRSADDPC